MSLTVTPKVICRQIEEGDLDAVADLLLKGFTERSKHYWLSGFAHMRRLTIPPDSPRYGMMLDWNGKPVGVMLMLFSSFGTGAALSRRCNLSSWYVDPAFGSHTASLVLNCLRRKAVTYTNISPAPHTVASVEAVKFLRYTTGYVVAVLALMRGASGSLVRIVRTPSDAEVLRDPEERDLIADHAAMGCLCVVVEQNGAVHPFVFQRFRMHAGRWPMPIQQLIFCRHIDEFIRFAGPIGRTLLRRGIPFIAFDTDGEDNRGLPGFFLRQDCPKYYRGPDRPRLGDLAYTERVIFGP